MGHFRIGLVWTSSFANVDNGFDEVAMEFSESRKIYGWFGSKITQPPSMGEQRVFEQLFFLVFGGNSEVKEC